MGAKKPTQFPEKELKNWLKNRKQWDHNNWLTLLDDLRKKGYSEYSDSDEGRTRIGEFLEANREKM